MPPSTPDTLYTDPRCLKKKAELDVLAEGLKAANIPLVHWDEADGPTECVFVQNQDFKAYLWEAFMPTAEYADWLLQADMASAYAYERLGTSGAAVEGAGRVVAQDAVARRAHRGAADGVPRCAHRVGASRPVQVDRVVPAAELSCRARCSVPRRPTWCRTCCASCGPTSTGQ